MYYLRNIELPVSLISKLPLGGAIIGDSETTDMEGKRHETYIIRWWESNGFRRAHFDQVTGEYLGEALS